MKNYKFTSNSVEAQPKKNGGKFANTLYKVATGIGIYAILIGGIKTMNYFDDRRDMRNIEENSCRWEEVIAEKDFNYKRAANRAIDESHNLGAIVGIDRLTDILEKANNDREIEKGQSYKILTCKSNQP